MNDPIGSFRQLSVEPGRPGSGLAAAAALVGLTKPKIPPPVPQEREQQTKSTLKIRIYFFFQPMKKKPYFLYQSFLLIVWSNLSQYYSYVFINPYK